MNKRIEELAKESGAMFEHMTWVERDLAPVFEKFAELIVRECAEWLKKPVNQTPLSGEIMNIAAERLKEHFGVEE